jgi:molecular chaperone GrpE (heat shock protein)
LDYLKKIAASDLALSENLAESKRSDCLIRWLGNLGQPFDSHPSNSTSSPNSEKFEPLVREARDEIVELLKRREALQSTLINELQNRSNIRKALEVEIQTIRRDQLAKLTGVGA